MRINIKPLSVNQAWQGKRFKTDKYKMYESVLLFALKPLTVPDGKIGIKLVFGLSNSLSDIDNPVKPFVDVLQKFYGFNDRNIYKMEVTKEKVKKGGEFIEFDIWALGD